MRIVKVPNAVDGEPDVKLVDAEGEPVSEVEEFLRLLTVPGELERQRAAARGRVFGGAIALVSPVIEAVAS